MPSHPSHRMPDHGPVYSTFSQESASSGSCPSFPTSLQHHVESSNDRDLSSYGIVSSPAEHHTVPSQQEQVEQIDPDLSPTRIPVGRPYQPDASPGVQQHDYSPTVPDSTTTTSTHIPPPPPVIPNSAPAGQFDMQPPPASMHASWQALHDYAQSHASEHGYALSINTTAKNRSRIKLACVCYGAPKNTHKLTPETRVRKNRQSYKTGCKMWIEGKKQGDGLWALRVGEPQHNHAGRAIEGWAVQRKRTWGVHGGRVGVGGVTAKEEKDRLKSIDEGQATLVEEALPQEENIDTPTRHPNSDQLPNLETGGLVWKIVEQEMLAGGRPGEGRDRGVGRTVKILEERLPGIHIFKRDVYNIRAQIKRARKAANAPVGVGLDSSDVEVDENADAATISLGEKRAAAAAGPQDRLQTHTSSSTANPHDSSQIDPSLIAQCNSALKNIPPRQESEVQRLRREVGDLRAVLALRTKELEVKSSEADELRVQVELANMALYNERGGGGGGSAQ